VDPEKINSALADVKSEKDPTLKSAKLASLCTALWSERGVELVVVGDSAIELLSEGANASGDLDMCHVSERTLPIRQRQETSLNHRFAYQGDGRREKGLWHAANFTVASINICV
jgi:hypothetical protein